MQLYIIYVIHENYKWTHNVGINTEYNIQCVWEGAYSSICPPVQFTRRTNYVPNMNNPKHAVIIICTRQNAHASVRVDIREQ